MRLFLQRALCCALIVTMIFCIAAPQPVAAFSVLSHEQIVDLLWKPQIRPLLLKRFPRATEDELIKAHAFAYGGSLIQDMGYYPFGNKYFSDLVHYVRSGDFVENLIAEAQDVNEYAFALGALSHYAADITGHPTVNRGVAIEFPKLARKFGERVTYAQDPKAHIQTEFGFDVVQVAKQQYSPDGYRDFIGFEVSKPVLVRAFLRTYGIELKDVFRDLDLSIGTFRRSVSTVVPEMTRVALLYMKKEMLAQNPTFSEKKFLYSLKREDYERRWGKTYKKPGVGTRILAFILRVIPKVGPFRALAFKTPSPDVENMYLKSVNDSVANYSTYLRETRVVIPDLPNRDFDTGKLTVFGEYPLTDESYAHLLHSLVEHKFDHVDAPLRENILNFYANAGNLMGSGKNDKKHRQRAAQTAADLAQLKSFQAPPSNAAAATQIKE